MARLDRQPADKIFLSLAAMLILFGLVMLSSASAVVAYQRFQDSYYFVKQQIIHGILPGLILFCIFRFVPYRFWKPFAAFGYLAAVLLLAAIFIPGLGVTLGGAQRWLNIGGITIQPAELAKFFGIIFLAAWLSRKVTSEEGLSTLGSSFMPFIVVLAPVVLPIMFQPDIGTMIAFMFIAVSIYFVAGARWRHLSLLAAGGIAGIVVLIKLAPYRMARLMAFMDPNVDPQGIGYHIQQALIAVGSGGIFGVGLGHSQQKFLYLPEVSGDSIFAIVAEELGFVFSTLVVLLFLAFVYRGITIAFKIRDIYGRLIVVGAMAWIGFQAFINMSAMIGVLPLTGIPLPFVSYGGTAIAVLMGMVGMVANISTYKE